VKLADEVSSFTTVRSSEKQVGGATDGKNAAIRMALNKAGTKNNGTVLPMDLKAQKSWFVFDDQIVALGSGIQGTTSASIETVIENRMLDSNSTYQLLTNQGEVSSNGEQTMQANEWLLLSSSQKNQSIGYYFPQEETITLVKEQRTGKYSDINEGFPNSQVYTENYQKVLLNHGQKQIDEKYAYVLLPNATKQGLENYAKQNRIEILSNEKANQSVKDTV
ncbi:polysaccharide lyase family 8 super-sandwich domain-containing protein, partial [Vibrio parahaemolyticus]|nr:polysaccharide lyase family 8 super-sandwich domain-containing protein [Vibrio parahaemolyticus]